MRIGNEPTKNEVALAIKEQMRQFDRMRDRLPGGVTNPHFESSEVQEVFQKISQLLKGEIRQEEFESVIGRLRAEEAAIASKLDDPTRLPMLHAEKDAAAKNLSPVAKLLASGAARRAGDGLSKEEWISEVLTGHSADDEAQLGRLRFILALWSDGPWPWRRWFES